MTDTISKERTPQKGEFVVSRNILGFRREIELSEGEAVGGGHYVWCTDGAPYKVALNKEGNWEMQ